MLQPAKLVVYVCGDDAVLIRCLCYKPKLFVKKEKTLNTSTKWKKKLLQEAMNKQ